MTFQGGIVWSSSAPIRKHKTQLAQLLLLQLLFLCCTLGCSGFCYCTHCCSTHTHTRQFTLAHTHILTVTRTQCKLDHLVLAACIQLHFVLLQLLSRFAAQWRKQMACEREEHIISTHKDYFNCRLAGYCNLF